jgi:hypothetical protein
MATITGTLTRIDKFIDMTRLQTASRLANGLTTQKDLDELYSTLDMDFNELAKFQELKSLAMMSGTLSQDEAQQIYMYIGPTCDAFNKQDLAVKVTLTKIYAELLGRQLSGKPL